MELVNINDVIQSLAHALRLRVCHCDTIDAAAVTESKKRWKSTKFQASSKGFTYTNDRGLLHWKNNLSV